MLELAHSLSLSIHFFEPIAIMSCLIGQQECVRIADGQALTLLSSQALPDKNNWHLGRVGALKARSLQKVYLTAALVVVKERVPFRSWPPWDGTLEWQVTYAAWCRDSSPVLAHLSLVAARRGCISSTTDVKAEHQTNVLSWLYTSKLSYENYLYIWQLVECCLKVFQNFILLLKTDFWNKCKKRHC